MGRSPAKPITVVLVEDHRMFREQLGHLIDKTEDMAIVGEADNIRDACKVITETRPSVAVVDITLRGSSGLELLKDLRADQIDVPVLILSMYDESLYAERALRAGARGYVTKHEASENVIAAIRQIMRGDIYLKPRFMAQMASRMMLGGAHPVQPIDRLADRELEVFELIGQGMTTRQISEHLGVSMTSVDTYRNRIKEKLKLENMSRLRFEASRWVHERE